MSFFLCYISPNPTAPSTGVERSGGIDLLFSFLFCNFLLFNSLLLLFSNFFFSRSPKRRAFYFTDVHCWSRPVGFFLCNPPPPHEVVYSMTQQDLTAAFKAKADSRSLGSTSPTPCTSSPDFIAMTSALSSRMRTPLFWVCDPHVNQ